MRRQPPSAEATEQDVPAAAPEWAPHRCNRPHEGGLRAAPCLADLGGNRPQQAAAVSSGRSCGGANRSPRPPGKYTTIAGRKSQGKMPRPSVYLLVDLSPNGLGTWLPNANARRYGGGRSPLVPWLSPRPEGLREEVMVRNQRPSKTEHVLQSSVDTFHPSRLYENQAPAVA